MNPNPGALLVIGSGLKLYREYLVRSVSDRAREAGLRLVLINNLKPTWQHEYFDDITVVSGCRRRRSHACTTARGRSAAPASS